MLNDPDHTQIPNNMSKDVELKKKSQRCSGYTHKNRCL